MKAKKWVTFFTAGASLISLICAIVAKCSFDDSSLMYDISMAIFGSALLGFIVSLVEYFAERRKAMETFLGAAYKDYAHLRNIKFFNLDEPQELILDCIFEEQHNKTWGDFDGETAKELGFCAVHKKRDAFISWMEENDAMCFTENDDIGSILLLIYNERIKHYSKMFAEYMDMYIVASKINLEDLSNAFGNLDFLFDNKNLRRNAYKSIYTKLQEYHRKITSEVHHFNMVKDGHGNFATCCKKVMALNQFFFSPEIIKSDGMERIVVYQRKFDDLSDRMEEFRTKIYFRKDVHYEEKTPVFSLFREMNGSVEGESTP